MEQLSYKRFAAAILALLLHMQILPAISAAVDDSLDGIWQSKGYGWVLEIEEGTVSLHHHTSYGCIDEEDSDEVESLLQNVQWIDEDSFILDSGPDATSYRFIRLEELPSICGEARPNSPPNVLEFVVSYMEDHYAFFDVRLGDWSSRVARARALVDDQTDDEDLLEILVELIGDSGDGHLTIVIEDGDEEYSFPSVQSRSTIPTLVDAAQRPDLDSNEIFFPWWANRVNATAGGLVDLGGDSAEIGPLAWHQFEDTGYMIIGAMTSYSLSGEIEDEVVAVNEALDQALVDLEEAESIIVDVSLNLGGSDEIALAIARRFAAERTFIYDKRPHGRALSEAQRFHLEPSDRPRYTGPVHLVTSDLTESAAEVFTLAMKALPNVLHYGTATHGSLSDMLEKPLPNGWTLTLSNEIYSDVAGDVWESQGIPVDIELDLYNANTIDSEPHLELLLERAEIFEIEETALSSLSTQAYVGAGENTLIAGLIIEGTGTRDLAITVRGPSLAGQGIASAAQDVDLRIFNEARQEIHYIESVAQLGDADADFLQELSILPQHNDETALVLRDLAPGAYHIHVTSHGAEPGLGVVELFDVTEDPNEESALINLSVRGLVWGADKAISGGFIVTGQTEKIILARVRGPSLEEFDIGNPLSDPELALYRQGVPTAFVEVADMVDVDEETRLLIEEFGYQVEDPREAVALVAIPSGAYAAAIRPADGTQLGVAVVEVFSIQLD